MSTIIHGDCLEVLAGMGPDSVDAVVTDPPYGLKFMGKDWDHGLPGVHFWEAVSRVLKPGAHLLAFGGTRTFHRLTCAVEDAGFEIRDCLMWLYSQGFPKGHDVAYKLHQEAEQEAEHDVRFVRDAYLSQAVYACHECGQVLLTCLSEPGASQHWRTWSESKATGCEQPGVEGWSHLETPERELLRCPVCSMSHGILADGAARRLRDGAPPSDGRALGPVPATGGSGASRGPQSGEQRADEPRAVSLERCAQARRGWNVALKPAWEPVIVARKPLAGTVAANVTAYGTGAINVDGCRVGTTKRVPGSLSHTENKVFGAGLGGYRQTGEETGHNQNIGRWPANVVLDEEVTDEDWRRYFYCPKASRAERNAGLEGMEEQEAPDFDERPSGDFAKRMNRDRKPVVRRNHHPTVKPVALMRWLVRLVTQPGGTVLDPFTGSGTTGVACAQEGFDFIGIEREEEYVEIARRRIEAAEAQMRLEVG